MAETPVTIRVQPEPFDVGAEIAALSSRGVEIGAVATFTGYCRSEPGTPVTAMTLEHFPGMAEEEIAGHVANALARWSLLGVTVIHRYGRLVPGDPIVFVGTASAHRKDAFEAAEFLMDYLKTRAPFWKREERPDGEAWVAAQSSDDEAAARWHAAAAADVKA